MGSLGAIGRWDDTPAMRTHRVDAARDHLDEVLARHTLEPKGTRSQLDFVHRQTGSRFVSFHSLTYGAEVEVNLEIPDFYFLQITLQEACRISSRFWDVILKPGSVFIMNPTIPYTKSWSANARQLQVKIPATLLRQHLQSEIEDTSLRDVNFSTSILSSMDSGGPLLNLVGYLCRDFLDEKGLWRTPSVLKQMESSLLSAILHTFPHSQSLRLQNKLSPAAPCYIRRAEEYIRANLHDSIGIADICAVTGVSARTLQDGFRRFRDATPALYIRNLRLDMAKQQIKTAKKTGMNVTQIALACGFNHVGRFANLYRERFGEMPLQALRNVKG
jgi:AraC-like DNA-binding protein